MVIVLTKAAKSRLAFHRIRPATVNFMRKTAPSRFDLMNEADADAAVDAAFRLCQRSELAFQDELRFVCMISTLFGHHFYLDRRYDEISHILFNPAQMARRRRARNSCCTSCQRCMGLRPTPRRCLSRHTDCSTTYRG